MAILKPHGFDKTTTIEHMLKRKSFWSIFLYETGQEMTQESIE
jgi:hypothetical protein